MARTFNQINIRDIKQVSVDWYSSLVSMGHAFSRNFSKRAQYILKNFGLWTEIIFVVKQAICLYDIELIQLSII
jgi:hypothetical protein